MKGRAFTLIELLVVVLITGMLSAIALPQYQKAVYKTRYGTMKIMAHALLQAQQVYYLANGTYSEKMSDLGVCTPDAQDRKCTFEWGYCALYDSNPDGGPYRVQCHNPDIGMSYQIFVQKRQRVCFGRNLSESSVQNTICKAETGATSPYRDENLGYLSWTYKD